MEKLDDEQIQRLTNNDYYINPDEPKKKKGVVVFY